jgi:hypothetical protein
VKNCDISLCYQSKKQQTQRKKEDKQSNLLNRLKKHSTERTMKSTHSNPTSSSTTVTGNNTWNCGGNGLNGWKTTTNYVTSGALHTNATRNAFMVGQPGISYLDNRLQQKKNKIFKTTCNIK